jgi:hypothetical protein
MGRKALHIDGRRRHDHFQIRTPGQQALQKPQQKIDIQ